MELGAEVVAKWQSACWHGLGLSFQHQHYKGSWGGDLRPRAEAGQSQEDDHRVQANREEAESEAQAERKGQGQPS